LRLEIAIIAFLVIAAGAGWIWFITTRNNLVRGRNDLAKAWTSLDQLLKQRRDELPRLIGICRGYLMDPSSLLEPITAGRAAEQKASEPSEKAAAAAELSQALTSLFTAAERDVAMRLDASYRQLKKTILGIDERIDTEGARFNQQAVDFNSRLTTLIGRLVARAAHLRPQPLFRANDVKDA
jgi:LemA protein